MGVYLVHRRVSPQAPFIPLIEKGNAKDPCFSPDGSQIVFSWKPPNSEHFQLYLVGAGGGEPRLFSSGPADDIDPAWSPDGERICFVRHGLGESALYARHVRTGEERRITTLIDSPNSNRLDWLSDSRTVVLAENWFEMPLTLVDTQSGARRELMPAAPAGYASPRRSPNGKWIAVTKFFSQTTGDLFVAPVKGGGARRLTFDNYGKRCLSWTPDGSGIVFRAPLDNHLALLYVPFQGGMARRLALPYVPGGSFDIKKSPDEKGQPRSRGQFLANGHLPNGDSKWKPAAGFPQCVDCFGWPRCP